ncbi:MULTISPECIES: hypothetical protein [Pectobacterium]|uniref:Uncharacterized protein n=1 Tax=Pectobacterium aquaticum TaxID=2204145 RepID=A0A3R8NEP7_9GAMM|nr:MULTISPECIES: hypothetical protein [Pectobacterium]MDE8744543.1 hypothetical protein [Pectobacterium polaris]RRO04169.1 hypothetical protein DMB85_018605 [Pectobacterium aquaticum]
MSMSDIGKEICDHLTSASINNEAMEIEGFIKIIVDESENIEVRKSAIDNLLSRCHPKWLCDYYVEGVTYQEWTSLISRFDRSLNKFKKKLKD